jgi:hypothetical protein
MNAHVCLVVTVLVRDCMDGHDQQILHESERTGRTRYVAIEKKLPLQNCECPTIAKSQVFKEIHSACMYSNMENVCSSKSGSKTALLLYKLVRSLMICMTRAAIETVIDI